MYLTFICILLSYVRTVRMYVFIYIFSGEDDQGCEFVKRGGDGVMSVVANVTPSAMHK